MMAAWSLSHSASPLGSLYILVLTVCAIAGVIWYCLFR
jgi:hypothetical protein